MPGELCNGPMKSLVGPRPIINQSEFLKDYVNGFIHELGNTIFIPGWPRRRTGTYGSVGTR